MNIKWLSVGLAVGAVYGILSSVTHAQEVVLYSQGFESGNGDFVVLEDANSAGWAWGSPSAVSVGPGAAHSGGKCWGTVLNGPIPRTCDASIVSPPINLPTIAANEILRVRFWAYIDVDGMRDRGEFFVSTNRTSWQSLIQFYNNMEHQGSLPPTWKRYEFSLDPSFSGQSLYLRFRGAVFSTSPTFYCGGSGQLSGIYVDDIAVTKNVVSGKRRLFTMEAWEDPSTSASCPWIAPWTGSSFEADNDIYSVARGAAGEYTDAYRLRKPLTPLAGKYWLEVQERENETSFTDLAALQVVDHTAGIAVAPDGAGNLTAYQPGALVAPRTAVSGSGDNLAALVSSEDGSGFAAYSGDTVSLDFGTLPETPAAVLVLKVKGFVQGDGAERPFVGPPAVVVETRDNSGNWIERGRLLPRFENSVNAFNLKPFLASGDTAWVRLRSISHETKYHSIDFVALYAGPVPEFSVTSLAPDGAWFGPQEIRSTLTEADANRFKMSSGEKFSISFPVPELAAGQQREFIFKSRGYYLPNGGSYLVYTWDGTAWVQRDSFTFPGTDTSKTYDLSLFLPDPNGELRVRVWQDYQYEPAGIDRVSLAVDGVEAPVYFAWDYRKSQDILSLIQNSDDSRTAWSSCPRDRVTEFAFVSSSTNIPPHVLPVTMTASGTNTNSFIISWLYGDNEGAPQFLVEIQIWTGPGATGVNLWNPPPIPGTNEVAVYDGPALPAGTYFVRVRANDGSDWGPWSEGTWINGEAACVSTIGSVSALSVNPQTGLLEQKVTVVNPCATPITTPFRLLLTALPTGAQVYNATGTNAGTPFVQYDGSIAANASVTLTIEYYASNRLAFVPTVTLEDTSASNPTPAPSGPLTVTRAQALPGGNFLVEFNSASNHLYLVEYSTDMTNWVGSLPSVRATANRTQWVDSGPPKTPTPPGQGGRFYRVVELP